MSTAAKGTRGSKSNLTDNLRSDRPREVPREVPLQPVAAVPVQPRPLPAPALPLPHGDPMPAYTVDGHLARAQLHSFVLGSRLRPVLENIIRLRYSIKTQRDTALQQLETILNSSYDFQTRIGDNEQLINVSVSAAADFLYKITSGLDVGEREGEVTNNMDDKKLSVLKSSQELLKLMLTVSPARAASYGIFDRAQFEAHYSLTWT